MKIGILGSGSMAQAIAYILTKNGHQYNIFSRKESNIAKIVTMDIVFLCIPSSCIESYLHFLHAAPIIVSCAKGVANVQNPFISTLFNEENFAVLSGPNFAKEIIQHHKSLTTIASTGNEVLTKIENILGNNIFQIEKTTNVKGVEICGIIKNAIAIIMGFASIKMPSWNEKALILTKLFQESERILQHYHCHSSVLNLSCGIGDIFLTCSSINSRNYQHGISIAQNNNSSQSVTIEGVRSLEFIKNLPLNLPYMQQLV